MTFKILLDDSNEIVCRSIVRSALDSKLPNLRVKPDIKFKDDTSSIKNDFDPDSETVSIPPTHKKEQVHPVPTQQQTRSQTRIWEQLLQHNQPIIVPDTISPSLPNPQVSSKDLPPDDDSTVPDTFVYMKSNGEKSTKPPLWKPFKVPLLDKNGEQRYDDNGNPITIIARDSKSLHSTVLLTNPDKHGEIKQSKVVEMIGDYKKILEKDKDCARALQDLQYHVVYNRPSHQKKPKLDKCKGPAGKQDEPYYNFHKDNPSDRDSAYDDLLTYNKVLGFINKQVTDEDGEYWQLRSILGIQHTPPGHQDRMGIEFNVKMLWETGEVTYKPLDWLAKDIPVELAQYDIEHNLLDTPGWKRFKRHER